MRRFKIVSMSEHWNAEAFEYGKMPTKWLLTNELRDDVACGYTNQISCWIYISLKSRMVQENVYDSIHYVLSPGWQDFYRLSQSHGFASVRALFITIINSILRLFRTLVEFNSIALRQFIGWRRFGCREQPNGAQSETTSFDNSPYGNEGGGMDWMNFDCDSHTKWYNASRQTLSFRKHLMK